MGKKLVVFCSRKACVERANAPQGVRGFVPISGGKQRSSHPLAIQNIAEVAEVTNLPRTSYPTRLRLRKTKHGRADNLRPTHASGCLTHNQASYWWGPIPGMIYMNCKVRVSGPVLWPGVSQMRAEDPRIEKLIKTNRFRRFPRTKITVCAPVTTTGQQMVGYSIGADGTEFDMKEGLERSRFIIHKRTAAL